MESCLQTGPARRAHKDDTYKEHMKHIDDDVKAKIGWRRNSSFGEPRRER